jgi:FMN phosphatase YigB (HAD superfamily)
MIPLVFDIDGTLTESTAFDAHCYKEAVFGVLPNVEFKADWGDYQHITDSGILYEICTSHNLVHDFDAIEREVKRGFFENVDGYLSASVLKATSGAVEFLRFLNDSPDYDIAFATGGWKETAIMKLHNAGFSFDERTVFSASDAHERINIMSKAQRYLTNKLTVSNIGTPIYFGDASWDVLACSELNWPLILVGDRVEHENKISHFDDVDNIMHKIIELRGLLK